MLQFNPDGTLKLSGAQAAQVEAEKGSVIINREQISEKPARAQISVTFPEPIANRQEILDFYNKIDDRQFNEVRHELKWLGERTFIIKVEHGSMMMYSLLNFMMMCFKSRCENHYGKKVVLKGRWASFG